MLQRPLLVDRHTYSGKYLCELVSISYEKLITRWWAFGALSNCVLRRMQLFCLVR